MECPTEDHDKDKDDCSPNHGCDGRYWGNYCDKTKPRDHAELSKCKLVDRNGRDVDFTDSDTNNYGGKGCRNYREACEKLSRFCRDGDTYNMGSCLSRELACLRLNVACGKISKSAKCKLGNITYTVDEICKRADDSIKSSPFTPNGHSQRATQDGLRKCLNKVNMGCR